jgi:AcrR family transcriptional regulator
VAVPNKRVQSTEQTRAALLDAAEAELHGERWGKVSLETLARRAGVTKQTLLRHFGSRDGLLMQALGRGVGELLEQRLGSPSGDVAGAVQSLLDHYETWGERSLRIDAWQNGPPPLAQISRLAREAHCGWVEYAFGPWLAPLREPARTRQRAALIALCDVHAWWLLANDLALPRAEVEATLTGAIERLVGERG